MINIRREHTWLTDSLSISTVLGVTEDCWVLAIYRYSTVKLFTML